MSAWEVQSPQTPESLSWTGWWMVFYLGKPHWKGSIIFSLWGVSGVFQGFLKPKAESACGCSSCTQTGLLELFTSWFAFVLWYFLFFALVSKLIRHEKHNKKMWKVQNRLCQSQRQTKQTCAEAHWAQTTSNVRFFGSFASEKSVNNTLAAGIWVCQFFDHSIFKRNHRVFPLK